MYNSNYAIDIIVNGNSCKQYKHNGRTYIEAKDSSEYEIKINNNKWQRVLVVSAVDGLNVLTGEPASIEDSGYVVNAYSPLRIKGFRYSDDKVGAFKFSSKNNSYTATKGDSQNVGVIGVRIFDEKTKPIPYITSFVPLSSTWGYGNNKNQDQYQDWRFCCDNTGNYSGPMTKISSITYDAAGNSILGSMENGVGNLMSSVNAQSLSDSVMRSCTNTVSPRGFDMGTTWGQEKESKVTEVEFEKGAIDFTYDIYYASRESLIEMGIPLGSNTQVSFPESFPKRYATPPTNWRH